MFARKYRIHAVLILSVIAIIVVPQITNKPDKNKTDASISAATEFLQMVDQGNYADSWQIADSYLQKTIPLENWEAELSKTRATLGAVSERNLKDVSFTAATEELPDSEFIMLKYETRFNLKELAEVITVVQGKDNRWRVVGYFIQ